MTSHGADADASRAGEDGAGGAGDGGDSRGTGPHPSRARDDLPAAPSLADVLAC